MQLVWCVVVIVLSLVCWGDQTLAWFAPVTAARLGLVERETEVEPAFWADVRGEALWDAITLWPMAPTHSAAVVDQWR